MKVYLSLTRPKLKRGAEWKLAGLNGLVTLMLVMASLYHWRRLWVAVAVYVPLSLFFRWAAHHDAQWTAVYTAAWGYKKTFLAHSDPFATASAFERWHKRYRRWRGLDRVIPKFPRWV